MLLSEGEEVFWEAFDRLTTNELRIPFELPPEEEAEGIKIRSAAQEARSGRPPMYLFGEEEDISISPRPWTHEYALLGDIHAYDILSAGFSAIF